MVLMDKKLEVSGTNNTSAQHDTLPFSRPMWKYVISQRSEYNIQDENNNKTLEYFHWGHHLLQFSRRNKYENVTEKEHE